MTFPSLYLYRSEHLTMFRTAGVTSCYICHYMEEDMMINSDLVTHDFSLSNGLLHLCPFTLSGLFFKYNNQTFAKPHAIKPYTYCCCQVKTFRPPFVKEQNDTLS